MNLIRRLSRFKNKITKSKFQNKLHKVTSNEKKFPTQSRYNEVALHSFYEKDLAYLLKHLQKKLQSKPKK